MKKITTYISEDGKEFATEEECLTYEATCPEFRARTFLDTNTKTTLGCPDVYNVYDADVRIVHLESAEDVEVLDIAMGNTMGRYADSYIKESADSVIDKYPCDVVVFANDSYTDIYNLDDFRSQLTSVLCALNK